MDSTQAWLSHRDRLQLLGQTICSHVLGQSSHGRLLVRSVHEVWGGGISPTVPPRGARSVADKVVCVCGGGDCAAKNAVEVYDTETPGWSLWHQPLASLGYTTYPHIHPHQWSWEDPSTLVHSKPMALEAYGTRSLWHSKPMAFETDGTRNITCGTYRLSGPRVPSPPVSTVDSVAPYPVPTINRFILEGPVDAEIIRLYYYRRVRRFNSASVCCISY